MFVSVAQIRTAPSSHSQVTEANVYFYFDLKFTMTQEVSMWCGGGAAGEWRWLGSLLGAEAGVNLGQVGGADIHVKWISFPFPFQLPFSPPNLKNVLVLGIYYII